MRILIAPDKFKGTQTAREAAAAMAEGLRSALPDAELDLCPLADGGEGTVDALVGATHGKLVEAIVTGPLPRMKVRASIGLLGVGDTAAIEMSAASGLQLLAADQRDPTRTTTFGTGELILEAVRLGARHIVLGIGGSATIDGGIGCAQACGAVFRLIDGQYFDETSRRLSGGDLTRLHGIEAPPTVRNVTIDVACDVGNVLLGRDGAAAIFGPQKGATPEQIDQLEAGLARLVEKTSRHDLADRPGSGAAGGLGFGMMAFFNATLRPGADVVFKAVGLERRLAAADVVVTGEGSLDAQSLGGKTTGSLVHAAGVAHVPCIALAGQVLLSDRQLLDAGFAAAFAIGRKPMSLEESIAATAENLRSSAEQVGRMVALKVIHR